MHAGPFGFTPRRQCDRRWLRVQTSHAAYPRRASSTCNECSTCSSDRVSFHLSLATITAPIEVQHIPKFRSSSKSPVCGRGQVYGRRQPSRIRNRAFVDCKGIVGRKVLDWAGPHPPNFLSCRLATNTGSAAPGPRTSRPHFFPIVERGNLKIGARA